MRSEAPPLSCAAQEDVFEQFVPNCVAIAVQGADPGTARAAGAVHGTYISERTDGHNSCC